MKIEKPKFLSKAQERRFNAIMEQKKKEQKERKEKKDEHSEEDQR